MTDLAQAKELLTKADRQQLVDHAFGDAEVYWFVDGQMVAAGYFGRSASVGLIGSDVGEFAGEDAWALRYLGNLTLSERNDGGAR